MRDDYGYDREVRRSARRASDSLDSIDTRRLDHVAQAYSDPNPHWPDEEDVSSQETSRLPMAANRAPRAGRAAKTPRSRFGRWFQRRVPSKGVRRAIISFVVLVALLGVIAPIGAVVAYSQYQHLKALATDGLHHLENVKAKLPTSTADITTTLNAQTLAAVTPDIQAAQNDFTQLNTDLHSSALISIAARLPGLSEKIVAARHLTQIGLDITNLATVAVGAANLLLPILHSSPLSATTPIVTQAMLTSVTDALNTAEPLINDIGAQTQGIALGSLLSASQQALLGKFTSALPQIHDDIGTIRQFLAFAPAFFSLGKPTTYLLLTLDRSELRAGGGFQGDYAYVTFQDGHLVGKLSLSDIYSFDDPNGACWNYNSLPPDAYSWWPFRCWGIRDSNVSPDFPTDAKAAMSLLHAEGGQSVAGVIAITPVLIQQVLQITGPLHIGYDYNVDVTPTNLESLIHQFQLTAAGVSAGTDLPPPDQLSSVRKRFSGYLGKALQDRLHGLPSSNLVKIVQDALSDIKTKDVQVYFANAPIQAFFSQHHLTSEMDRSTDDGVFVVDSNSYGKQTPYVHQNFQDSVQIDSKGGATHTLTLTYNMLNPNHDPVYGNDFFKDYLRIYASPHAKLISSDNFNITATTSDEPNRAMWGGWQIAAVDNAGPNVITIKFYVPNVVDNNGNYQLTFQRQAGTSMFIPQGKNLVLSARIALGVKIFLPNATQPAKSFASGTGDISSTWVKDAMYQCTVAVK